MTNRRHAPLVDPVMQSRAIPRSHGKPYTRNSSATLEFTMHKRRENSPTKEAASNLIDGISNGFHVLRLYWLVDSRHLRAIWQFL